MTLRGLDRLLALGTWLVAAALALMLLIGPKLVADDKESAKTSAVNPYSTSQATTAPADGKKLFSDSCGSCHTLAAAGTDGTVGPKLDGLGVDEAAVREAMRSGPGLMPTFEGDLAPDELAAVAAFVATASK